MKRILLCTLLAFLCICGVHYLTGMTGLHIMRNSIFDMAMSAFSCSCCFTLAQKVA